MAKIKLYEITKEHGIAMYDPDSNIYFPYETGDGFAMLLVDLEDGIDPLERFQGVMARRCPAPCMMTVLNQILTASEVLQNEYELPEPSRTRFHVILGGPGVGKTELALVLAEATGAELYSIPPGTGGGNLDELIKETRFGDKSSTSIIEAINRKLVGASKDSPLARLLDKHKLLEEYFNEKGEPRLRLDFNCLASGELSKMKELQEIASIALPREVQNNAPITYGPGRLLKKLIEAKETGMPVEILIDEFNRYENTGALMQNLFEVLSTTRDHCTIASVDEDGNPKDYTFTKQDLAHVRVLGTGNIPDAKKEPKVKELSDSLESRVGVKPIQMMFGAEDYAHRSCQQHLDLALTTHMKANTEKYTNAEKAGDELAALLELGKTPEQKKAAPRLRGTEQMLANAGDVVEAATLLGNVYFEIQEVCANKVGALRSELGKKSLPTFGPRQVKNPLAEWAFNLPKNPEIKTKGAPTQYNFGTRTVNALIYWVNKNFPKDKGFENTRAHIGQVMLNNRIISTAEAAQFAPANTELTTTQSEGKTVAELLNVNSALNRDDELTAAQILLFEMAKRQFSEYAENIDPDSLFNKIAVGGMLDEYRATLEKLKQEEVQGGIQEDHTFRNKYTPELVREGSKFTLKVSSARSEIGEKGFASNFRKSSVESQLLEVISNQDTDMSHLFALRDADSANAKAVAQMDPQEKAAIAETWKGISCGIHPAGIHMTTLALETKDELPGTFVLLRNVPPESEDKKEPTQYMLVGERTLDESVVAYLKRKNIDYINRNTEGGKARVSKRVSEWIETGGERVIEALAKNLEQEPGNIADNDKVVALKDYANAWDRALSGTKVMRLFATSPEENSLLNGQPLSQMHAENIRDEADPEKKDALRQEHGVGLLDRSERDDMSAGQKIIARIKTKVAFLIGQSAIDERNAVVPLIEPKALGRAQ